MNDSASTAQDLYKQLVDTLVAETIDPVEVRWIREWGTDVPKSYVTPSEFNAQMEVFSAAQRVVLAELVRRAFSAGMFHAIRDIEASCRLSARVNTPDGESLVALPVEPFDNAMYQDFIGRRDGWEWPDR